MTSSTTESSVPVRPMNEDPISYPTAALSSLSEDARHAHRYATQSQNSKVDRDIFDRKSVNSYLSPTAPRFEPTERMLAAFAELTAAGLASYDADYGWLRATRVHAEYTVARGRGAHYITVSTFGSYIDDAKLLVALVGADFESRNARQGVEELVIRARHESATDFEHDASSTAMLTIRNISAPEHRGYGHQRFTGVLTEARLYPLGVDPTTVDDGDTRPGEFCDRCDDGHPFAPYQPPVLTDVRMPKFVVIETWPLRPYLVADATIPTRTESETTA